MGSRAGLDVGKFRPSGIRFPDRPARSQSLYRLSYSAHGGSSTVHIYTQTKTERHNEIEYLEQTIHNIKNT